MSTKEHSRTQIAPRPRLHAAHAQARNSERPERQPAHESVAHSKVRHRLTWFWTVQSLAFVAVVMFAATYALVSGILICGGIAMCVVAILRTCMKGQTPRAVHLALATFWASVGAIFIACT